MTMSYLVTAYQKDMDKVYDEGLCQDNDCEHGVTEANQFAIKLPATKQQYNWPNDLSKNRIIA